MSAVFAIGCWVGLAAWVVGAWIRGALADRAERPDPRRVAECSAYGGKLAYPAVLPSSAGEDVERERLRSGVAFAEAMLLQRDEIRSLPETRAGRSIWS